MWTHESIRWAALTSEQQTAMTNYRQLLLDVLTKKVFQDITWPEKPEYKMSRARDISDSASVINILDGASLAQS